MVNLWATLKVIEAILPATIIVIFIVASLATAIIKDFKWNRKIKWLKSHGFERYLKDISGLSSIPFYAWKNKSNAKQIDERRLRYLSYKDFVQEMKEPEGDD